jgi:hypothetical protein
MQWMSAARGREFALVIARRVNIATDDVMGVLADEI